MRSGLVLAMLCAASAFADPGLYRTTLSQGESFSRTLTWTDSGGNLVNLTGYTAKMDLRSSPVGSTTALLTLTDTSGLTLGGAAGTIVWEMTDVQTLLLPTGTVAYDLRLTSGGGEVTYLIYGTIAVRARVTH